MSTTVFNSTFSPCTSICFLVCFLVCAYYLYLVLYFRILCDLVNKDTIQYKKEFNTKEGANIMPSAAGNVAITEQHNVIQYSTMRFMLLAYCRIRYGIYIPCHWFAFSSEWGLLEFNLNDSYYCFIFLFGLVVV